MIVRGVISSARGALVDALLSAAVGDGVRISTSRGEVVNGVVTASHAGRATVAVHGSLDGVCSGDAIAVDPAALTLPLGTVLLGRSIDACGEPLDDRLEPKGLRVPAYVPVPAASARSPIEAPFWTGIRAIDGLLTLGRGSRVGIFGPPGSGKSTLLEAFVRSSSADAVVVGLIGERGREAQTWMRAVPSHCAIVCATSDRSAAERVRAATVAIAQAAALRSRGLHVLFILDSLARYAAAVREVAVGTSEPVGRAGYPPSVFAELARYVEAAGTAAVGSITLIATVLSDGDERDPVSDASRSLLDGHVQLSPSLAQAGRFPAIDVPASASRTMAGVAGREHMADAATVRRAIAVLAHGEEARSLGILPSDPFAVRALGAEASLEAFLRQCSSPERPAATLSALAALADTLR